MARAGHTTCPLCGAAEIAVTRTGAGTLNLKCHKCEFTGYAKPGTRASRLMAAVMVVDSDEPDAQEPKSTEKRTPQEKENMPPPVVVKKPVNSAFSLGQL